MESTYVKPILAKYGNSMDVIKGECGFGLENIWLDKTNATITTRDKWVVVRRVTLMVGPWYEERECRSVNACSTESDEC